MQTKSQNGLGWSGLLVGSLAVFACANLAAAFHRNDLPLSGIVLLMLLASGGVVLQRRAVLGIWHHSIGLLRLGFFLLAILLPTLGPVIFPENGGWIDFLLVNALACVVECAILAPRQMAF